jgi:hypothetical protein
MAFSRVWTWGKQGRVRGKEHRMRNRNLYHQYQMCQDRDAVTLQRKVHLSSLRLT